MQNWYKNVFVDATVPFQLPYADLNCFVTGFQPELPVFLRLCTPWTTEQTYYQWKPINTKLDMCDANIQKLQFSNLTAY